MKRVVFIFLFFYVNFCFSQNSCEKYDIFYGIVLIELEQKTIIKPKKVWEYITDKVMVHPEYKCKASNADSFTVSAQFEMVKRKVLKYSQDPYEEITPAKYKTVIKDFGKKSKYKIYKLYKNQIRLKNKNQVALIDFFDYEGILLKSIPLKQNESFILSKTVLGESDYVLIKIRLQ